MKNADKPANPVITRKQVNNASADTCEHQGLTKREMFAMHAMNGYLSNSQCLRTHVNHAQTAEKAVLMADALLAELEK